MGSRIKQLRKILGLTQQKFGDRLGVKQNTIAQYEIGRNAPVDSVISLICREFNVSETWLRTGEGAMFIPQPSNALDTFIRERNLSATDRILIEKFASLDEKSRQVVVDYVLSVADEIQKTPPTIPPFARVAIPEATTPPLDATGQEQPGKENAENKEIPIPVGGDGLEAQKKQLMKYLDMMDPGQLQMYYDQMRRLKEPPTEASPLSALAEADQKAPEFDSSGLT